MLSIVVAMIMLEWKLRSNFSPLSCMSIDTKLYMSIPGHLIERRTKIQTNYLQGPGARYRYIRTKEEQRGEQFPSQEEQIVFRDQHHTLPSSCAKSNILSLHAL